MKNLILLLAFSMLSFALLAQNEKEQLDVVYLKNGDIIRGRVTENHDDYLIIISKAIGEFRIPYQDIKIVNLIDEKTQKNTKEKIRAIKEKDPSSNRMYLSVAPGFGFSYGGIGLRVQQSFTNNKIGFAHYIAVGYSEYSSRVYDDPPIYNGDNYQRRYHYENASTVGGAIGVKLMIDDIFYLSQSIFFNELDRHLEISHNLMCGVDFFVYKSFGLNIGIGLTSNEEAFIFNKGHFAFDVGMIYKFEIIGKKLRKEKK